MNGNEKTANQQPTFSGCGMCGAVGFSSAPNALSGIDMPAMVKSIHHRGPNGNGTYEAPNVAFGHTRLSILDLSENGHQPMTKGDFTITYNGEVYNYPDLRASLLAAKPDLKLDSSTDTEVLLHSVAHCIRQHTGEGFADVKPLLNRLNGFFAFGIWDSVRQRLLLVRDRYGIKPLYYYHKKGEFVAFASEVEALCSSKLFSPLVDMDTLRLFVNIGSFFCVTPKTLIDGVHSVLPGHYMWIDTKTGQVEDFEYYRLPDEDPALANVTKEEATAHMKHLMEDSIQLRMVSDVPLSTFLSGGIDSSLITAIASHSAFIGSKEAQSSNIHSPDHPETQHGNRPVTAFTVTYTGQGQNPAAAGDEEYARKVSTHLGPELVNHQFVQVDPMTFTLADMDELGDLGTFSDDDRLLTILMNYRAVKKEGFSVILNGQGADEAMGGYVAAGFFKAGMLDLANPDTPLMDKLLDLILDQSTLTEPVREYLSVAKELYTKSYQDLPGPAFHVVMQWLFKTSLHRILRFEDFLSMRSAVECRVPILDYRLVDYCFRLPWRMHVNTELYTGKLVLREVSKAYLPEDVCDRPKQAFPNVNPDSLNARLKELILENWDAIRNCPLVKYVWIPELFETHESLNRCTGSDFWLIITYWRWWIKFTSFGGAFPPDAKLPAQ